MRYGTFLPLAVWTTFMVSLGVLLAGLALRVNGCWE